MKTAPGCPDCLSAQPCRPPTSAVVNREYRRVLEHEVQPLLAEGWHVADGTFFADHQVSWLVWREAT